jgi:uncharacterized protein YdaU (DUF1376 family)
MAEGTVEKGGRRKMTNKKPNNLWFPIWAADLMLDRKIGELEFQELGMLLKIWCLICRQTCISFEPKIIAKQIGCEWKIFKKAWPKLEQFLDKTEGGYVSIRMQKELSIADSNSNAKSKAGKASAEAKKAKKELEQATERQQGGNGTSTETATEIQQNINKSQSQSQSQRVKSIGGKPPITPFSELPDGNSHTSPDGDAQPQKRGREPEWAKAHRPEVLEATRRIIGIWPTRNKGDTQPNGEPVPNIRAPALATNLAKIQKQGGDLAICEAIARRTIAEWKSGAWIKAPQHYFGEKGPWKDDYKAHVTNAALTMEKKQNAT